MKKITEKDQASHRLFLVCWLVYMIVCMSKTNYTASIAYIVREGIFSKSDSGTISACFYLLYGISQFFGGRIADRFSPFKVLAFGVGASVVTNLILCFTISFKPVLIIWSLTGLLQFGVWPSVARIVSSILIPEHRQKAGVYITFSLGVGGILSYVTVTPILERFGWSGVFLMNVLMLLFSLILWLSVSEQTVPFLYANLPQKTVQAEKTPEKTRFMPLFFASGMFLFMFMYLAQGMLDNGVKSWAPTMMMESYHLSASWASIQTAILYISNILLVLLISRYIRKAKNAVLLQTLLFLVYLPASVLLLFIGKISVTPVVLSMIVATSAIYAMTSVSVKIAGAFAPYGASATVSGIFNALTCFGIVISNMGYGYIAEHFGWNTVTVLWLFVCMAATLFGAGGCFFWRKFLKRNV